jgi:hypothetical protein
VLLLLSVLSLCCGCLGERVGVSVACTGYVAGPAEGNAQISFEEKTPRLLPGEMVRAALLLTAVKEGFTDENALARVVYDYDAVYMKAVVLKFESPAALLSKMNALAEELGMKDTVFGSLSGTVKSEADLYAALELVAPDFSESKSTLADLLLLAKALYGEPILASLYGKRVHEFPGESAPKTRSAQLLRPGNDQYLEAAVFYISGTVADAAGKVTGIALAGVTEEGQLAFSAVADHSGLEDPIPYMASDAGNLCGKVLGKNYGLNKAPVVEDPSGGEGTVFLGTNLFYVIVFLVGAVVFVLFAIGLVFAVINTMKRNIDGRKKYAPPKE